MSKRPNFRAARLAGDDGKARPFPPVQGGNPGLPGWTSGIDGNPGEFDHEPVTAAGPSEPV